MDRLSKLPDELIQLILSKLEMRDVVRTTILSKSWLNLWKTVPCLSFEISGLEATANVRNFINRVLILWNGTELKIFKITVEQVQMVLLFRDICHLVEFAIDRKVEELHIIILNLKRRIRFTLPQSVYSCSSITSLTLYGCSLRSPKNVGCDRLRILCIRRCWITEDVIDRVVSGSPKLETIKLVTSERIQNMTIKSTSLQIVEIGSTKNRYTNTNTMLAILAPKLRELAIYGPAYEKCWVEHQSSLAKVELLFTEKNALLLGETLRQILPAIQHVEDVKLSHRCFEALLLFDWSLSPFLNAKLLEFYCYPIQFKYMAGLLEAFPALERLTIHWDDEFKHRWAVSSEPSKNLGSILSQLRTVDIVWHDDREIAIFEVLTTFLKHATEVTKIVIQDKGVCQHENKPLVRKRLASLRSSFPEVKVILVQKISRSKLPFLVEKLEATK